MNLSRFLRSLSIFGCIVAGATVAEAQTYDFKGYIDTSHSDYFQVGETIDFRVTLQTPLINDAPVSWGPGVFWYRDASASLLIGGIEHVPPAQSPLPAIVSNLTGGVGTGWGGYFDENLEGFSLVLNSPLINVVGPDGILVGGIPIDDFSSAGGSWNDFTADFTVDRLAGTGTWKMTEYSILLAPASTPVPEPATYGAVAAFSLGMLALAKRRRRSA